MVQPPDRLHQKEPHCSLPAAVRALADVAFPSVVLLAFALHFSPESELRWALPPQASAAISRVPLTPSPTRFGFAPDSQATGHCSPAVLPWRCRRLPHPSSIHAHRSQTTRTR